MEDIIALSIPIIIFVGTFITILGGIKIGSDATTKRKQIEVEKIEALTRLLIVQRGLPQTSLSEADKQMVEHELKVAEEEADRFAAQAQKQVNKQL